MIVVDLEVTDINLRISKTNGEYLVRIGVSLGNLIENVGNRAGDDTAVRIALRTTRDRIGLTRTCLTVSKYCAVVAFKAGFDHLY